MRGTKLAAAGRAVHDCTCPLCGAHSARGVNMESGAGSRRAFAARGVEQRCPHIVIENFLGAEISGQMLRYAVERHGEFKPATVNNPQVRAETLDRESRNCLRREDVGPFTTVLKDAIVTILHDAMAALHILGRPGKDLEFETCAYGDGAFFAPHIDISVAAPRRVLSSVYYFFGEPRGFEGGLLLLFGWPVAAAPAETTSVEIVPRCDSLVIFPSMLRHEVTSVVCPSGEWRDYRFSVNCWAHRRTD